MSAFVTTCGLLQTTFLTPFQNASTTTTPLRQASSPSHHHEIKSPRMLVEGSAVEFQAYSGGIDRKSQAPYKITRYLFKDSPRSLAMGVGDKDVAVNAAIRQVFGNAYLMEEERDEVYVPESMFRCGRITAKEFVRALAKSSTYKKRFFESVSQFRFIELNHKHLLGRAPLDKVDYSKHFKSFANGGYDEEIDSYLDDGEYDDVFGEDFVPYTRFRGTYAPINQFNRMCTLEGGFAGSDKFKGQMLTTSLLANLPTTPHSIVDGLPPIPNAEHPSKKYGLPSASLDRYRNELEVAKAKASELQRELEGAYANYESSKTFLNPFKSMVADMELTPLYGRNYGNGAVSVFSGQYTGTPAGEWGKTGTETVRGRTRRVGFDVGKKEKRLEALKQLIVDIERKVDVLNQELDSPVRTPSPIKYRMPMQEGEEEEEEEEEKGDDGTGVDEEEQLKEEIMKKIEIVTNRQIADVGKTPGEIIKEIEEEKKAAGKSGDFLGGKKSRKAFPGDGSEMVVGS
eukprot:Plantae.Rhodophyta-Hildenbrandia_rubra.ctg7100.p1 GENE.Plantae.Rhodophyta-Hildenbrandia_rubra.ctg7100~~Plantae.Rhodophyta-Hildenbrandia_rubra.ctg7100.p1  ORF type:complete len:513 (-),score=122.95 Plantae.Rhodophyta-Hildenbrandia_rubra.ctg7100:2970-4508(-)